MSESEVNESVGLKVSVNNRRLPRNTLQVAWGEGPANAIENAVFEAYESNARFYRAAMRDLNGLVVGPHKSLIRDALDEGWISPHSISHLIVNNSNGKQPRLDSKEFSKLLSNIQKRSESESNPSAPGWSSTSLTPSPLTLSHTDLTQPHLTYSNAHPHPLPNSPFPFHSPSPSPLHSSLTPELSDLLPKPFASPPASLARLGESPHQPNPAHSPHTQFTHLASHAASPSPLESHHFDTALHSTEAVTSEVSEVGVRSPLRGESPQLGASVEFAQRDESQEASVSEGLDPEAGMMSEVGNVRGQARDGGVSQVDMGEDIEGDGNLDEVRGGEVR
eukprot:GHVN01079881.1.p1 GENE.GHVN01079881.1~~GHVN01079881.1.p1  ORF type:complete len:353 (+),score=138.18 GHVN01079881.1:60-1061(+)